MNNLMLPVIMGTRRKKSIFYDQGKEYVPWVAGYSVGTGNQSKETDHLYLYAHNTSGTAERVYVTDCAIYLDQIAALKIDWANDGSDDPYNGSYFIASTEKNGDYATHDAQLPKTYPFTRRIESLDVSGLTGAYYIRAHARDHAVIGTEYISSLHVYKVWGEDASGGLVTLRILRE